MELFALVKQIKVTLAEMEGIEHRLIDSIVRTYESRDRAMEDVVLLQETNRDEQFNVVAVPHIER